MLEDRRPTANPRLTRNASIVFLRLIIDLFGIGGRDNGYWLRQVPSDDARNRVCPLRRSCARSSSER